MVNKKNPTNADIYQKLGGIQQVVKETNEQAKLTNGRVTELEAWKRGLEAIDQYKREHPRLQTKAEGWTAREKSLVALISTLIAIITAMIGIK